MIEMTPAARQRLDDYLQRLRSELRGTRGEVADEVEQSVREHIEMALEGMKAPLGEIEIIGVLDRLGPPEQWLAEEDRPTWHRALDEVRSSSDDSRLPYIALGLVLVAIATFMFFGFLLVIPAMFVSRAWIEQKRERGEPLGARRWLVYPAIALVLAFAAMLLLFVAPVMTTAFVLGDDARQLFDIPISRAGELRFLTGLRGVIFGAWWIVAGGFCAAFVRRIRHIFSPLLDGLQRKHFAALAAIGGVLAAAGAALIYYRH